MCVLPWLGHEVRADGSTSFCCITDFSFTDSHSSSLERQTLDPRWVEIKNKIAQGLKPEQCAACWHLEKAGLKSRRQKLNNQFQSELHRLSADTDQRHSIQFLDIKLGNVCNQKCLICGPESSSFWIKEAESLASNQTTYQMTLYAQERQPVAQNAVCTAREIHIAGGEPFLAASGLVELLSACVEAGCAKSQRLVITTNGSVQPDAQIVRMLDHFESVRIMMSADGVAAAFEYLRYPGKWSVFLENYHRLSETPHFGGICLTLSALNCFNLVESLHFWEDLSESRLFINVLDQPEVLSTHYLGHAARQAVCQKLLAASFKTLEMERLKLELFSYLRQAELSRRSQEPYIESLLQFISKHDRFRKLSFAKVFPEYFEILQSMAIEV